MEDAANANIPVVTINVAPESSEDATEDFNDGVETDASFAALRGAAAANASTAPTAASAMPVFTPYAQATVDVTAFVEDPMFDPDQNDQIFLSEEEYQAAKTDSLLAYHDIEAWKAKNDEKFKNIAMGEPVLIEGLAARHLQLETQLGGVGICDEYKDRENKVKMLKKQQKTYQGELDRAKSLMPSCLAKAKARTESCRCAQFECENDKTPVDDCANVLELHAKGLQLKMQENERITQQVANREYT